MGKVISIRRNQVQDTQSDGGGHGLVEVTRGSHVCRVWETVDHMMADPFFPIHAGNRVKRRPLLLPPFRFDRMIAADVALRLLEKQYILEDLVQLAWFAERNKRQLRFPVVAPFSVYEFPSGQREKLPDGKWRDIPSGKWEVPYLEKDRTWRSIIVNNVAIPHPFGPEWSFLVSPRPDREPESDK